MSSRAAFLWAGIAAIGFVASISCEISDAGVGYFGMEEGGTVVATIVEYSEGSLQPVESLVSGDGGLTWTKTDELHTGVAAESAETPRGRYVILDQGIALTDTDGESEMAYSTAYLRQEGNMWSQWEETTQLGHRELTTRPRSIIYDERSNSLIAAMGIQGVVVRRPSGEWTRQAVGPYLPTDFSFTGKSVLLLSHNGFWGMSLSLSLTMVGLAILLVRFGREATLAGLAALALTTLVLFGGVPIIMRALGHNVIWEIVFIVALVFSPVVTLATTRGIIALGFMPRHRGMLIGFLLGLAYIWLLASGTLLIIFGTGDAQEAAGATSIAVIAIVLGIVGLALTSKDAGERPHRGAILRHWPAVIAAFLGMNVLIVMTFMLWLHLDVALTLTRLLAIVLVVLVARLLVGYITSKQEATWQADTS